MRLREDLHTFAPFESAPHSKIRIYNYFRIFKTFRICGVLTYFKYQIVAYYCNSGKTSPILMNILGQSLSAICAENIEL